MNQLSCCFKGPNPQKLPYGADERHPDCHRLKVILGYKLERMVERGVTTFLTGMMPGPDTWCAELVLALKKKNTDILLNACLPYEEQHIHWRSEDTERYFNTLAQADNVTTLQTRYTSTCMSAHRQRLLNTSSFILAIYDGSRDGTKYMLEYAARMGLGIVTVHPVTLERRYVPGTK